MKDKYVLFSVNSQLNSEQVELKTSSIIVLPVGLNGPEKERLALLVRTPGRVRFQS